jgi:hypothetical protein
MGYYMGDYYSLGGGSSFYRGDPFWGFLGRVIGGLTGLGGIAGKPASSAIVKAAPTMATTIGKAAGSMAGRVGSMIARHPVLSAAGAAAVLGTGAGVGVSRMGHPGVGTKGFHLNKHGKMVRNRHMRVTNPKALRRAIRRAHGFAKMAKKCIAFTSPHKPKGRMYFRTKRRK